MVSVIASLTEINKMEHDGILVGTHTTVRNQIMMPQVHIGMLHLTSYPNE